MSADATFDGPGLLVVLSGPSGVGKNTVVDRLVERSSWTRLVTATTRRPRPGERDGVDYLFISPEEFQSRIEDGFFLEHTETYGDLYGSPVKPVREAVARGEVIILVIDVKGGERLRELGIEACYIFIAPPDTDSLISRLERRATEDEARRDARVERAKAELDAAKTYDHVVVNRENDIDSAVAGIEKIIERELAGRRRF
ncbi:MAG: guanylate kinase [Planctomycetota bacterium]|nr:MAG: guanylate kinase [Planctomycetota bacterium]